MGWDSHALVRRTVNRAYPVVSGFAPEHWIIKQLGLFFKFRLPAPFLSRILSARRVIVYILKIVLLSKCCGLLLNPFVHGSWHLLLNIKNQLK
jgi:hypothetical protein